MHTLKVTLRQHTPLIHFQHDQEGATLRASEVKPKLDKFILTKLGEDDGYEAGIQIAKYNGWLVGKGDHPALDYKMRIVAEDPQQIVMNVIEKKDKGRQLYDEIGRTLYTTPNYPDNSNSLIMGNMGGRIKEDVLNFVMFRDISIHFIFKEESLQSNINNGIFDFFSETNFGNRTSKGFGSFLVDAIDNVECKQHPAYDWKLSFIMTPDYGRTISANKAYKDIFVVVNKLWKGLKKYSDAPKNQLKSVFLNQESSLTNNEDRIPSPIFFKPIVKKRGKEQWNVDILAFLNLEVVEAANANANDFYDLLDSAVKDANCTKSDEYQLTYCISNIKIK